MKQVLIAINLLKTYNQVARDDRFSAVIDIMESIVRDEMKALAPNGSTDGMSQIQKDMLKSAMDNLGTSSIRFEDGPIIRREDLE